jgi:imidazolonepropionase-like amidohydrolase
VTAWRLPGTLLPGGDDRQLWAADGMLTSEAPANAEPLPGRFTLPGLVDAHAHLALRDHEAGGASAVLAGLAEARDRGVLLLRDVGAPKSATLDVRGDPTLAELPELIAAGRWHAPEGRFFGRLHDPVSADELLGAARTEIARGATWIKIIGDWRDGSLSYAPELVRELVQVAHSAGARVTAHTQWQGVRQLVDAGIDSVEHGSLLDLETLHIMAERGIAWTPTLTAFNAPLPDDASDDSKARHRAWLDNVRAMLPEAVRLGVPVLAGTDGDGTLVDEVRWLIEYGLSPTEALASATTTARAFLRRPALDVGAPADVLTFDADPRDDPSVLERPAAVLLRGRRVR